MIDFFSRLDMYMKFKDLNDNKITVEAGISNGLIGKGRKRGSLSQDSISKILCFYSDLSADWLLTGRGEMIKTTESGSLPAEIVYRSDPKDAEIISSKNEIIETQKKLISSLEQRIKDLEHGSSHVKVEAFPSAQSVASTGGASQGKTTK